MDPTPGNGSLVIGISSHGYAAERGRDQRIRVVYKLGNATVYIRCNYGYTYSKVYRHDCGECRTPADPHRARLYSRRPWTFCTREWYPPPGVCIPTGEGKLHNIFRSVGVVSVSNVMLVATQINSFWVDFPIVSGTF